MKKALLSVITLALCAGCATNKKLPPSFYALGTSTAVSLALHNSPQTAGYLRAVQPVVCSLATGRELTPEQIRQAVADLGVADAPEATAIVNSVLMLYIVAFNAQGTNAAAARPYAQAIFCDGLAAGLGMSPTAARLRAMPLLPIQPLPSDPWPLLRGK